MKILAIMGSPRRGESYKVVRQLEEKLTAHGDVEFEYLWLREAELGECTGCHACIMLGEEYCPVRAGRDRVLERMEAADGIILASPVYTQHVSALMKNFLDRLAYLWHRPRFFDKTALVVANGGGQFKETLGALAQNAHAWGMAVAAKLGVPHPDALRPAYRAKTERDIDRAAAELYRALQRQAKPAPTVWDLLWFAMWRMNAAVGAKDENPDYRYWQERGWLRQDYYYPAPIPLWRRMAAQLGARGMKAFLRRVYEGY